MSGSLDHRAWVAYLDMHRRVQDAIPTMHQVPTRRWNALMDRFTAAVREVRADPDLLSELRRRVHTTTDAAALALLHDVLGDVVLEHRSDVDALRADPRVGLGPEHIEIGLGVYLAEMFGEHDPYEWEGIEDDSRDLNRIGGAPTLAGAAPYPDDAFLLQVDLRSLHREARYDPATRAVLQITTLPHDGLLQAFHTTTGDSYTDPEAPGGGGTLRYVTEDDLARRRPPQPTPEDYPASHATTVTLPCFRSGPGATDDAFERVDLLQEEAYRVARNGYYPPEYLEQHALDPFTAGVGAVTHLGGLQSPDFDASDNVDLLRERLPLRDDRDHHVLLLDIAADHTFDEVFGGCGRLEFWLRRSDISAGRFGDCVTLIHST